MKNDGDEEFVIDEDAPVEDAAPIVYETEDLAEDVPALDLDEIEQFTEEVEQHDEVGEEAEDGDSEEAPEGSEAETGEAVTG